MEKIIEKAKALGVRNVRSVVRINLRRGQGSNHPDIKTGRTRYIARIGRKWYRGTFTREWYGVNFSALTDDFGAGLQFDTPGTNASEWRELWEVHS